MTSSPCVRCRAKKAEPPWFGPGRPGQHRQCIRRKVPANQLVRSLWPGAVWSCSVEMAVGDGDTAAKFRLLFCKDRSSTRGGGGPRVGRLRNYSEDSWVRSGIDVTSKLRPRTKRARMVSATYLYVQETLNRR